MGALKYMTDNKPDDPETVAWTKRSDWQRPPQGPTDDELEESMR